VLEILHARGSFGETVDELATELGVAKKTIYNHFPTKNALINAALRLDTEEWLAELAATLQDPGRGFSEKVRMVLDDSLRKLQEREELVLKGRALSIHPEEWQISQVLRTSLVEPLSALIRQGIDDGVVRPDVDARLAAFTILNMTMGAVVYAEAADVPYSPQELLNESLGFTCRGILTERGQEELAPIPEQGGAAQHSGASGS
jgi:AcrR family transcriptional regulator